ncbi:hypothetical protein ABIC83_002487 [Roseateles asaccharophilus]|uniref:hypothetical protein n=1 Tax=Roseateles asaccharophilus TaxID=582607 RepID=UPI003839C985
MPDTVTPIDLANVNRDAMTLDEAVADLHQMVDKFKEIWRRRRGKFPEHYPEVLPDGEWFEQFMSECTSSCGFSDEDTVPE